MKFVKYYNRHKLLFNGIVSAHYGVLSNVLFGLTVEDFYWWVFMLVVTLMNVGINLSMEYLEKRLDNRKFMFKNFYKKKKKC